MVEGVQPLELHCLMLRVVVNAVVERYDEADADASSSAMRRSMVRKSEASPLSKQLHFSKQLGAAKVDSRRKRSRAPIER